MQETSPVSTESEILLYDIEEYHNLLYMCFLVIIHHNLLRQQI